jgi:glutamate---cysteine ligase / carboxylate-amine ligase
MPTFSLFEVFGIELEYMIVDAATLDVAPVADVLLFEQSGNYEGEAIFDDITWSNELVLHVVELKTTQPAPSLSPLPPQFQNHVRMINEGLASSNRRLMPGAMHPWMNPFGQMCLWPHDNSPVYKAFDRVFDCRGHGWANLQSMHINLPFNGDEEFARLHAAIRLVLPILPAIAASSPIMDGSATGFMDNRLRVYRNNSAKIPSIAASVIPEPVFSEEDYTREIFHRMFRDIAPHDPDGTLQDEWLNARGAIARFSRGTIEIRVIDVQECPAADLAVAAAAIGLVRSLVNEEWIDLSRQKAFAVEPLKDILWSTIDHADAAIINNSEYLHALGLRGSAAISARDLWTSIADRLNARADAPTQSLLKPLQIILNEGPLSRRILVALDGDVSPPALKRVYAALCDCLNAGTIFHA